MRRILDAKKQELQHDVSHSIDYAQMAEKTVDERRKEKQRQARQQAIQVGS